jgi:multidrug efflux pump subunit AcrA (membrane-fusion protein)
MEFIELTPEMLEVLSEEEKAEYLSQKAEFEAANTTKEPNLELTELQKLEAELNAATANLEKVKANSKSTREEKKAAGELFAQAKKAYDSAKKSDDARLKSEAKAKAAPNTIKFKYPAESGTIKFPSSKESFEIKNGTVDLPPELVNDALLHGLKRIEG